ncbi:MAG: L-2,4-diaminobutyrate decarboxylase [Saprospiraceae bacterium]|nr:MAG: L-2,4-diaminobutyrate decarboxylase [Saprospiraceae bacterium]
MMKIERLLKQLHALEKQSRRLEPSISNRKDWNQATQQYADQFLDNIEERNAYDVPPEEMVDLLAIEETPKAMPELLNWLDQVVDRTGLNPASGGHFGYIPGGGVFPSALGDYLAAVSNRYAGVFFANPGAVRMENQLIRWMCKMMGYPETSLGNLTSGGSLANLIAITTAREKKGLRSGMVDKAVIYLSEQVHHCVQKAIRIAGLGEATIRYIPLDERFRLRPDALEETLKADVATGLQPFLVVASAGTTDTGAIDPLDAIADLAQAYDLWFHVDAAYGGFFMMVEEFKAAFKGIEKSDSLAIDPHKGLFIAYGSGAVLIKDVRAQFDAHYYQANYMQDALDMQEELSPADLSPELTKHFRGLRMWLPLQLYGLAPFRAALAEKIYLCRYFYEKVQELGFEVGPYPELSVMIFRCVPESGDADAFNEQLVRRVREDGRVFLSSTMINGAYWIRMAVLSFRAHLREIDLCLEILEREMLD